MFLLNKHVFSVVILIFYSLLCAYCAEKPYNVHTLEGPTKIERAYSSVLDINCFIGKPKSIMHLWKTVKLLLDIPSDRFAQYNGYTPEEVWNAYLADRSLFSTSFFSSKKSRSLRLDPFNTTCVAIKTDERYVIELNIQNVDYWKMGLLCAGVFLFIYSRSLGENVMFFYLSGITLGVFASFMILVYFLSKMLPGKPIVYGAMIGGWTLGVYALQLLWSNFQPLLLAYHTYVAGYVAASGFLSFVICYKMGPPRDRRNKNLITWTLQAAGLMLIYFSTEMTEAFAAISLGLIIIKCIPNSWIAGIKRYWRLKNPPKRVLLSQEEYYKQGQRETEKALEELRGYCSSPECPQWKLMLKLKNPQKFANFIETKTHLSDDEIEEHDNSDIIIRRKNISSQKSRERTVPSSQINGGNETSDDSSLSSDEWNARLNLPSSQINEDNETSDDSSLSSDEWNGIRY